MAGKVCRSLSDGCEKLGRLIESPRFALSLIEDLGAILLLDIIKAQLVTFITCAEAVLSLVVILAYTLI
jgi:hypothetical protein